MLPGWYGFGTAVDAWLADESARRWRSSRDMHARWPFFRSVLSNMAMVLAKTDLAIASRYAELVPDAALREAIFARIADEHERTRRVTASRSPAAVDAARRQSDARAQHPQPLSVPRSAQPPAGRAAAPLSRRRRPTSGRERAIHLTINGLAAGLRNSG